MAAKKMRVAVVREFGKPLIIEESPELLALAQAVERTTRQISDAAA